VTNEMNELLAAACADLVNIFVAKFQRFSIFAVAGQPAHGQYLGKSENWVKKRILQI